MKITDAKIKIPAIILAVLLVFPCFVFPSFAEPENAEGDASFFARQTDEQLFSIGKKAVIRYGDDDIVVSNQSFEANVDAFEGSTGITVSKKEENAEWPVTLTKSPDTPTSLSSYKELYFQLIFDSDSLNPLDVTVVISSGGKEITSKGSVTPRKKHEVFVSLAAIDGAGELDSISLTFSSKAPVNSVRFSQIYADTEYSYEHIERFSAEKFSSATGFESKENEIVLHTKDGSADIRATFDSSLSNLSNTAIAYVTVSGADSGTLTFSLKESLTSESKEISTVALMHGKNSYTFFFPASKPFSAYLLNFSGISASQGEELTLHSVGFSYYSETLSQSSDDPGTISSCTLSSDSSEVRIIGSLKSSSAAEYMNAKLGIIAQDMWERETTDILVKCDMTTIFNLSVDTKNLPANPSFCKFRLVLIDGETVRNISQPVYPAITSAGITSKNNCLGLKSDFNSLPFEANASHTVIDVFLDRLESNDSTGGRLHSYLGSYRYLNDSYIKELDSMINFNLNAGICVYLRVIESSDPITQNTSHKYYSFDASDYDSSLRYMTMIDFLSSRYEGVSGFIAGTCVNSKNRNYYGSAGLMAYAENYAKILRMMSVVVRNNSASAFISVPITDPQSVADSESEGYNSLSGVGTSFFAPDLFCDILSIKISKFGAFQWVLTYESSLDPNEAFDHANRIYTISTSLLQSSTSAPAGYMLLWTPDRALTPDEIGEITESIYEKCKTNNARAAIISLLKENEEDRSAVEKLASLEFGVNSDRQYEKGTCRILFPSDITDPFYLFDFRNSYSVSGFSSAGNISSLTTETTHAFDSDGDSSGCRALSGSADPELSESGVILCRLQSPIDPTNADSINVALSVSTEESSAPVSVILGSGNKRCEYQATVYPDTPSLVCCDTSSLPEGSSVEYIALTFSPESKTDFSIASVSVSATDKNPDEIASSIGADKNGDSNDGLPIDLIIVICAVVLLSGIIFAALSTRADSVHFRKGDRHH